MLIGGVLVLAASSASLDADCVGLWKTLKDAARGSDLVFSGTVSRSDGVLVVSFDVDRVWKGDVKAHTTLVLQPNGMDEVRGATSFDAGETYVIFANKSSLNVGGGIEGVSPDAPIYTIGGCGGTATVARLGKMIRQLGKPRIPRP